MAPFPLTKLPYLPLQLILQCMDIMELVDLSLLSKHVNAAAISLHRPATNVHWSIHLPGIFKFEMFLEPRTRIVFQLGSVATKSLPRRLNGEKIPTKRQARVFTFKLQPDTNRNLSLLDNISRHVLAIFDVKCFELSTDANVFDKGIFTNTAKFEKICLENLTLSVAEARMLFEKEVGSLQLRVTEVDTPEPMNYTLKHQNVEMDNGNWLSFDSILRMECESLEIGVCRPNSTRSMGYVQIKDFVDFVRMWNSGGLDNLQVFKMKIPLHLIRESAHYNYRQEVYNGLQALGITVVHTDRIGDKTIQRGDGKQAHIAIGQNFVFTVDPNSIVGPAPLPVQQ